MQNMFKRLMALLTAGALSLSFTPAFAEETAEDAPVAETTSEEVADDTQPEEMPAKETGPCAGYDVVVKNTCLLRLRRQNLTNGRQAIYAELKDRKKAAAVKNIRQTRSDLRRAVHERRALLIKARQSEKKNIRDIAKKAESGTRSRQDAAVAERMKRAEALKKLQKMRMEAATQDNAPVETPADDSASEETETTESAE